MRLLLLIFILFTTLFAEELKNRLQYSTSPYLKQHETNPINWYPWGEAAFKLAKKEKKAVFLSIGYSTCHWCHVMAKESFENEEIAKIFNECFISIKVDREEMPHLDSYYQKLHKKLRGRIGGWPLSAFLTADKKPFYVATYIPSTKKPYHEGLDTLLPRICKEYSNDYESVLKKAKEIELGMYKSPKPVKLKDAKITTESLIASLSREYDNIYGGFGRQKKFPEASKLSLMMDLAIIKKDEKLYKKVLQTLDVMALRGIYDHIGGGFFRYSVDTAWEIPHFEKMLYNQAELIPLYVKAYLKTKNELYRDVVIETIAMLDKRFVKNNLYYSASDADTKHKEGAFFLYRPEQIRYALNNSEHRDVIVESLEFTIDGNFENKVHLNFYTPSRPKGFKAFKKELLKLHKNREYPFIDKKINTAWNALMIEALFKASLIDEKYALKAQQHLDALKEFMFDKGELHHQSLIGLKPIQKGLLEDYSFLISALIAGYEVDYKSEKLDFAEYLLSRAKSKFYKNGVWYLSDDKLNIRADLKDKYYSSALGKMSQNIIRVASLKASFKYEELALKTLASINADIEKLQSDAPASATAFMMQKIGVVTLKSSKKRLKKRSLDIEMIKHPYVLTKFQKDERYLACTMRSCFSIKNEYEDIKKDIEESIR